jgi:MoaA/NifB/PqqE/SkfB family radical SAM enzyme
MKRITGFHRYLALAHLLLSPSAVSLPVPFLRFFLSMIRGEKLTLLDGRLFIHTHFTPLKTKSAVTALKNFARTRRGETVPFSVYISLTDLCPYSCGYCSNREDSQSKGLSLSAIKELIAQIQDAGASCIGFTGGEPLLREDLAEIISSVDERSYTILFTSGHGLTMDAAMKLHDAGLTIAAVSLDSHRPDIHNGIRGSAGAFRGGCEAITFFSRAGIYTSVSCVLSPGLFTDCGADALLSHVHFLGAHELRFLDPLSPVKKEGGTYFRVTPEIRDQIESFRARVNRDRELPSVSYLSQIESKELFGCGAGRHHLYIDAKGNVCPCDFIRIPFGSVLNEPFAGIYLKMSSKLPAHRDTCLNTRLHQSGQYPQNSDDLLRVIPAEIPKHPEAFAALKIKTPDQGK